MQRLCSAPSASPETPPSAPPETQPSASPKESPQTVADDCAPTLTRLARRHFPGLSADQGRAAVAAVIAELNNDTLRDVRVEINHTSWRGVTG